MLKTSLNATEEGPLLITACGGAGRARPKSDLPAIAIFPDYDVAPYRIHSHYLYQRAAPKTRGTWVTSSIIDRQHPAELLVLRQAVKIDDGFMCRLFHHHDSSMKRSISRQILENFIDNKSSILRISLRWLIHHNRHLIHNFIFLRVITFSIPERKSPTSTLCHQEKLRKTCVILGDLLFGIFTRENGRKNTVPVSSLILVDEPGLQRTMPSMP